MPAIAGIAHVELSVSDLDKSSHWYCAILGATEVFPRAQRAGTPRSLRDLSAQSHTVLAFTRHDDPLADPFSPRRRGLNHFAFAVSDDAELGAWDARLTELNISHDVRDDGYARAITCIDPDGIAVEFYCMPRRG